MSQSLLNTLITASFPLAGVIIGFFSNHFIGKRQFERQKEWDLIKNENDNNRKQRELEMAVYNKILKIDGELQIVLVHDITEFSTTKYIENIRPIVYENFHLINNDIREMIIDIDNILKQWNTYENYEFADERDMAKIYDNFIERIKREYVKYEVC